MSTNIAPAPVVETPAPAAPEQPTKFQQALAGFKTAQQPPPPAPKPAPDAPDPDLSAARDQAAYLAQQRAVTQAKKQAEEAANRLKGLEVFEGKDGKAILAALKAKGHTVESLVKAMGAEDEPAAPPETDAERELRELKEWKAQQELEKQEREAQGIFQQNVTALTEMLQAQADKFPALSSFARAPQVLAQRWAAYVKENGEPEDPAEHAAIIGKIAEDFNASVSADVDNILSGDAAFKAFITRNKDRALTLLGVKQSAGPASEKGAGGGKGAAAIPATAAATGSVRKNATSHEDKYAAALGVLRKQG